MKNCALVSPTIGDTQDAGDPGAKDDALPRVTKTHAPHDCCR